MTEPSADLGTIGIASQNVQMEFSSFFIVRYYSRRTLFSVSQTPTRVPALIWYINPTQRPQPEKSKVSSHLKGSFPSKAGPCLPSQERTVDGLSHKAGNL